MCPSSLISTGLESFPHLCRSRSIRLLIRSSSKTVGISRAGRHDAGMIIRCVEKLLFASRWLLLPFLAGLVIGLAMLLLRFAKELWELAHVVWNGSNKEILTGL